MNEHRRLAVALIIDLCIHLEGIGTTNLVLHQIVFNEIWVDTIAN